MKQNETVNRGFSPVHEKSGNAEFIDIPASHYQRALEDSNPRPFGP